MDDEFCITYDETTQKSREGPNTSTPRLSSRPLQAPAAWNGSQDPHEAGHSPSTHKTKQLEAEVDSILQQLTQHPLPAPGSAADGGAAPSGEPAAQDLPRTPGVLRAAAPGQPPPPAWHQTPSSARSRLSLQAASLPTTAGKSRRKARTSVKAHPLYGNGAVKTSPSSVSPATGGRRAARFAIRGGEGAATPAAGLYSLLGAAGPGPTPGRARQGPAPPEVPCGLAPHQPVSLERSFIASLTPVAGRGPSLSQSAPRTAGKGPATLAGRLAAAQRRASLAGDRLLHGHGDAAALWRLQVEACAVEAGVWKCRCRVEQSPCPAEAPTHCVAVFSCSLASAFSPNPGSTFEGVAASRSLLDVQGCGLPVLLLTALKGTKESQSVQDEHYPETTGRPQPDCPIISCCGGGIFFFWELGVLLYLQKQFDLGGVQVRGASAGALLSTLVACDVDLEKALASATVRIRRVEAMERKLGLVGLAGQLVGDWLADLLPEDAAQRAHRRGLHIVVTEVPSFRLTTVKRFDSKQDLVQANLASTHIPFFTDGAPSYDYKGQPCIDGSLWDFVFADNSDYLKAEGRAVLVDYFKDDQLSTNRLDFIRLASPDEILSLVGFGYRYASRADEAGEFELALGRLRRSPLSRLVSGGFLPGFLFGSG